MPSSLASSEVYHSSSKSSSLTPLLIAASNLSLFLTSSLQKGNHLHRSSASLSGPVETGFKNATLRPVVLAAAALQSSVEKTVFPTSVLAPKIWYARRERQSGDASGGGGCGMAINLNQKSEKNLIEFLALRHET